MKIRRRPRYLRDAKRQLKRCRTLEEFDALAATLKTPAELELEAIDERRRQAAASLTPTREV